MNKERDGSVSKKDRCRFFMHEGVKRPPSHSTIRNLSYFPGYRGEIFTIKFCSSGREAGGCDIRVNNHCRFYDSDFGKMYSVQKKNEPHEAEKERGKLK